MHKLDEELSSAILTSETFIVQKGSMIQKNQERAFTAKNGQLERKRYHLFQHVITVLATVRIRNCIPEGKQTNHRATGSSLWEVNASHTVKGDLWNNLTKQKCGLNREQWNKLKK